MFSISLYIFEDFDFLYQFSKYLLGYFEYLFSLDENGADIRYFHLGAYSIFFCRPSYFFRLLFALLYFFQQIIHIKKNHMFCSELKDIDNDHDNDEEDAAMFFRRPSYYFRLLFALFYFF